MRSSIARVAFAAALAALLALAVASALADPATERPTREISLPRDEVKDSFLAYVLGIIYSDADIELDNVSLREVLVEFKSSLDLPFDDLTLVSQGRTAENGIGSLGVSFRHDMSIPVPFSLLGYHPGTIRVSKSVGFSRWQADGRTLENGLSLPPFLVFGLISGTAAIDVDEWLTVLFPRLIDDIVIRVLAVFRYKDRLYCMMDGTGRRGQPIAGLLDFRTNRIIFPLPRELASLAVDLLGEGEGPRGGPAGRGD